jgi:hypothetical protein
VAGDLIYHNGTLYKASVPITAGPFSVGDWIPLVYDNVSEIRGAEGWDFDITYDANDLTDTVVYKQGAIWVRLTMSYTVDLLVESVLYETSTDSGGAYGNPSTVTFTYDPTTQLVTAGTWS